MAGYSSIEQREAEYMDRWERFSRTYTEWADVQQDLATMGDDEWEAVSMVPVVIEALPVTTHMRFYLVMKRRVGEQAVDEWPKPHLLTDGEK